MSDLPSQPAGRAASEPRCAAGTHISPSACVLSVQRSLLDALYLFLPVILVCSAWHTLITNRIPIIPGSSEFVREEIFYCLLSSKHALQLMVFCQLIVMLKMFRDQIHSGTADPGEWLAHRPSVKPWSTSCTARGFKAMVLGDVPIRAHLGMSRIHYTDHGVSVLLWKLRHPPGPWL